METHFTIPGKPQGKARPRVRRDGHAYTPSQTTQYEELVRWCWRRSGAVRLNGAIRAVILARYPVSKRDSKKTQDAKICGEIPCTIKPDCDNCHNRKCRRKTAVKSNYCPNCGARMDGAE